MNSEFFPFVFLLLYIIIQPLVGYFLLRSSKGRIISWIFPITSILFSHFLLLETNPIGRMIGIILPLLHSMKIVVATYHPFGKLPLKNWLAYFFLTVGMNPKVFVERTKLPLEPTNIFRAFVHILVGVILLVLVVVLNHFFMIEQGVTFWACSIIVLIGLSLVFHFGILSLNTTLVRHIGYNDYLIFRKPFLSRSLSEFWSKRWNLAFSEMTRIAVFRPISKYMNPKVANLVAFLFSGLLHEIAISLSV